MNNDALDFERFMKQREKAASAYVNGDAGPLGHIVTHTAPATFFGPKGNYDQGPDNVYAIYEHDAKSFESGDSKFEILHMSASGTIGYWVGIQRASARMTGKKEAMPLDLRVTELFRREDDDWKMIHRHADLLKSESEKPEK